VRKTLSSVLSCLGTAGLVVALVPGCETTSDGIVDHSGQPPFVRATVVDPDTVNLRTIEPVNGLYPVAVEVRATVDDPDGTGSALTVVAELLSPANPLPWQEIQLLDDGTGPDVTAEDGEFTGRLTFELSQSDVGAFRVRVRAQDGDGFGSNERERSFFVIRENNPPLLSNLVAPDTVRLPTTGSTILRMTVDATDPDGPEDIRDVYFRSLDSSDPLRKFFLFDDGDAAGSGDATAGDGTYSILVQLPSTTTRKTYRFAFQAADTFGDTSATLIHDITIQ
jgi:hypothetical protein